MIIKELATSFVWELYAQALENAKVNGDKPVDWNARAKMLAQRIEEGIKERLEIYREAAQKTSISRKALDETYLTAEQVVEEIVNQELNLFETTVIYLKDDTKSWGIIASAFNFTRATKDIQVIKVSKSRGKQ